MGTNLCAKILVIIYHSLKIVELRFHERVWCAMDVIFYFFVVGCLFLAFVRCFAMAVDMFLRLVVCWNHIDGVAVCGGCLHMSRLTIPLSIWHLNHVEDVVLSSVLQMCMVCRQIPLFWKDWLVCSMVVWLVGIASLAF